MVPEVGILSNAVQLLFLPPPATIMIDKITVKCTLMAVLHTVNGYFSRGFEH